MTSLPVEVLLFIESSPEQREESFCFNITKFWRDSLINKGIIPISKKVRFFYLDTLYLVFQCFYSAYFAASYIISCLDVSAGYTFYLCLNRSMNFRVASVFLCLFFFLDTKKLSKDLRYDTVSSIKTGYVFFQLFRILRKYSYFFVLLLTLHAHTVFVWNTSRDRD